MLKKLAVIGLTAGALVLGAPIAASAAPAEFALDAHATYTDGPGGTVDRPVIDQCDSSTISFASGHFLAGERVSVSISGAHAADATISGNTAAADGSLVVSFLPPKDASGSYVLAFAGAERSASATITVANSAASTCGQDPAMAAPSGMELPLTGSAESGMELALTGGGVSTLAIVGGAAALAAGGALVVAGSRRKRA